MVLHQDRKILHTVGMSSTCGVRNQKTLPLLWDVVLADCVFSLLEKKQFWWITQSSSSVVLKATSDSTWALEMEKEFLSVCSCWCCDGIIPGEWGESAHGPHHCGDKVKAVFGAQTGWESWECPAWGWECSGETLEPLPVLKGGLARRMGTDILAGPVVTGQGVVVFI